MRCLSPVDCWKGLAVSGQAPQAAHRPGTARGSTHRATRPRRRSAPASGRSTGCCAPAARHPSRDRAAPSRAPTARRAPCAARAPLHRGGRRRRRSKSQASHRLAERHRILQRHAGALREVLHHRMRRIAQQRGGAFAPVRRPVRGRRCSSGARRGPVQQLARPRMHALEVRQHFLLAAFASRPTPRCSRLWKVTTRLYCSPCAQRVVHQVAVGAGPDHGRVPAQVLRHVARAGTTAR